MNSGLSKTRFFETRIPLNPCWCCHRLAMSMSALFVDLWARKSMGFHYPFLLSVGDRGKAEAEGRRVRQGPRRAPASIRALVIGADAAPAMAAVLREPVAGFGLDDPAGADELGQGAAQGLRPHAAGAA